MSQMKRWLGNGLLPLVYLGVKLNKLSRLWAHAQLRARLPFPVSDSVVAHRCPEIHGSAVIRLGSNVLLYRDLYWETQENGKIEVSDDVVISRGVHLVAYEHIHIGVGSMIGEYSSIRDANHIINNNDQTPLRDAGHCAAPIHIGKQVWVGRGVTVLAGVSIGDYSVIGANAVVTRDIPAHSLAVGIPARCVKSYT